MFQNKIQKSNLVLMLTIAAFIIFSGCDVNDNPSTEKSTNGTVENSLGTRSTFDGSSYTIAIGELFYFQYVVADEGWTSTGFDDDCDSGILACIQTLEGGDPCGVRMKNFDSNGFDVKVEEEKSDDTETGHSDELIGVMRFNNTGSRPLFIDFRNSVVGMCATANVAQEDHNEWHYLSVSYTFNDPVVFPMITTYDGNDPCHIRIRNVGTNSFEYKIEEWEYLWDNNDGKHCAEKITFMIVEKGTHVMVYDELVERIVWTVGEVEVAKQTWNSNVDIYLDTHYKAYGYPFVFTQCQTANGSDPIVIRNTQPEVCYGFKRLFSIRMQEEEANNQNHAAETIGYMVVGDIGPDICP